MAYLLTHNAIHRHPTSAGASPSWFCSAATLLGSVIIIAVCLSTHLYGHRGEAQLSTVEWDLFVVNVSTAGLRASLSHGLHVRTNAHSAVSTVEKPLSSSLLGSSGQEVDHLRSIIYSAVPTFLAIGPRIVRYSKSEHGTACAVTESLNVSTLLPLRDIAKVLTTFKNQDFNGKADDDSQNIERAMYLLGHYSRICLTTAAIACSLNGPAAIAFNILFRFTTLRTSWLRWALQAVLTSCAITSLAFIPALVYVVKMQHVVSKIFNKSMWHDLIQIQQSSSLTTALVLVWSLSLLISGIVSWALCSIEQRLSGESVQAQ